MPYCSPAKKKIEKRLFDDLQTEVGAKKLAVKKMVTGRAGYLRN
jgi:hypothetical protein